MEGHAHIGFATFLLEEKSSLMTNRQEPGLKRDCRAPLADIYTLTYRLAALRQYNDGSYFKFRSPTSKLAIGFRRKNSVD